MRAHHSTLGTATSPRVHAMLATSVLGVLLLLFAQVHRRCSVKGEQRAKAPVAKIFGSTDGGPSKLRHEDESGEGLLMGVVQPLQLAHAVGQPPAHVEVLGIKGPPRLP